MTPAQLLTDLYTNFNARNTPAVLAHMAPDVAWPASTEGAGYVHGPEAIGVYWARQWSTLDPKVTPTHFTQDGGNRTVVTVHQVVHDKAGNLLVDTTLHHIYTFNPAGQVTRMDIKPIP